MNLAIDVGNSLTKLAVFEETQIVDNFVVEDLTRECLDSILAEYKDIDSAIIVSVSDSSFVESYLKSKFKRFLKFDHTVKVPIKNLYLTPETLGCDRLAAAVGGNFMFPDHNLLIVDFGTAITIDHVTAQGEFCGGNISLGMSTRFKALKHFTHALPLCDKSNNTELFGRSTQSAIESGVVNGIVYEIEGYIRALEATGEKFKIIFTGGDGDFFAERIKSPIFATYDLVVYGLNRILEYNAQ